MRRFASVPVLAITTAVGLLIVGVGDLIGARIPGRERRLPMPAAMACLVAGALLLAGPG